MAQNDRLSNDVLAKLVGDRRGLSTFLSILAVVVSIRTIPALVSRSRKRNKERKSAILDRTAVQIALFPTLLSRVYPSLQHRFRSPGLAELLSSSLLVLLPPSWRIHVVLYAASSALYHSARSSRSRQYLPPTWTLNVIGNALLLWAFLFKSDGFPSAYERVILSNSTHYVPAGMRKAELEELLCNTTFSAASDTSHARSQHSYELCKKLHPTEPSCLKNYLKATLSESMQTCWWIGGFSALPFLISKQQRGMITKSPLVVLRKWLSATTRGTIFISASVTTAWALTCLLQRILPGNSLKRARWMINASIASLWILILPDKRRVEISLYVARLAVLCAWRTWRFDGGAAVPFGDVALLALSWMQLVRLQKRGEKISGLVGLAMAKIQ